MKQYFEIDNIENDFSNENHSPFVVEAIVKTVGQGLEMGGKIAESSAKKKEAEAKITEIGGKRQAQLKDCENSKEYKKFLDPKYRKNRIIDCKKEVNKRLDSEEEEQKQIVRKMTELEEQKIVSSQKLEEQKMASSKNKDKNKGFIVILGLAMILGTIIYLNRNK